MSESSLSRRLVQKLAPRLVLFERIENSAGVGTPDTYGENWHRPFWMELKHVHQYPKRPTTPIRFKRYTIEQARCIERLGRSGKVGSWILVQVEGDHWLFDHTKAIELQKMQPRIWWDQHVFRVWERKLDYEELAGLL